MSNIPAGLLYAKSHEWVKRESDGTIVIGITDYAQNSLGDITYVQTPMVGSRLEIGDVFGVVESVKAASDLYAPVAGEVVAVNGALDHKPETVNQDPYTEGWMLRLRPDAAVTGEGLLDAEAYGKLTG
ncbi:MAG: glycine cleavage system protein GcvH [Opitutaceae bacterium]|nr:glycine cleavage system protein GcvH [Opitutaceae bacterium]